MVFSREAEPLKIATFNINNINKRLHNLTAWLARAQPDVVCLQELKVEQRAFPASALRDLGYRGVWLGERSWNGVAILARECNPKLYTGAVNDPAQATEFKRPCVHSASFPCACAGSVRPCVIQTPNRFPV